mgnify:CR=1 FL=1
MTRDTLQARLDAAQATQRDLLQQRARLAELLDQAMAQLNQSQGRMTELTELLALEPET